MLTTCSRLSPFILMAGVAFLAATGRLLSPAPGAIAAQVAALGLVLWARSAFPPGGFRVQADPGCGTLLRKGPYRFLRHPMYAAALLFLWAAVLAHRSIATVLVGLAATAAVALRILVEERLLRARFPGYAAYARSTRALVPFLL